MTDFELNTHAEGMGAGKIANTFLKPLWQLKRIVDQSAWES